MIHDPPQGYVTSYKLNQITSFAVNKNDVQKSL